MRRVLQRQLVDVDEHGIMRAGSRPGDCFPACIASIFEVPLEQAPGTAGSSQEVWDWLATNYPGIGMVARDFGHEPRSNLRHQGYWIATVISTRFRESGCQHCTTDRRKKSRPPWFWKRDECPYCDGSGHARGLHAIVMENASRVWDPHPEADWEQEPQIVGETYFIVTDPARLPVRSLPQPLRRRS